MTVKRQIDRMAQSPKRLKKSEKPPKPTPTPDPNALFFDRGAFAEIDTDWTFFAANGFPIQPAQVGSSGVHANGTLDIMPRNSPDGRWVDGQNLEYCIDVLPNNQQGECDAQDGIGYEVYSPVAGNAYPSGHNITFLLAGGGYKEYTIELGGYQFKYTMRPEISLSRIAQTSNTLTAGAPVDLGNVVGKLCTRNNLNECDLASDDPVHLAYEVRFRFQTPQPTGKYFGQSFLISQCMSLGLEVNSSACQEIISDWNNLVRAVIAHPGCLYNEWNSSHTLNTIEPIICSQQGR